MSTRRGPALGAVLAVVTALAAVSLGPPSMSPPPTIDGGELSTWCGENVGAGEAVWYQDRWQCSHTVSGFFVLSPVPVDAACLDFDMRPDGATQGTGGILCSR